MKDEKMTAGRDLRKIWWLENAAKNLKSMGREMVK